MSYAFVCGGCLCVLVVLVFDGVAAFVWLRVACVWLRMLFCVVIAVVVECGWCCCLCVLLLLLLCVSVFCLCLWLLVLVL